MLSNSPIGGILLPLILAVVSALGGLLYAAARLLSKRSIRLRVPARLDNIRWLTAVVDELGEEVALSEHARFQCRLALDEAFTNIVEHAYAGSAAGEGQIEAEIRMAPEQCVISLTDYGRPYDPTQVARPVLGATTSLDDLQPGGLGLHLMRSVMDEVHYTSGPRGNRLVMVKHHRA